MYLQISRMRSSLVKQNSTCHKLISTTLVIPKSMPAIQVDCVSVFAKKPYRRSVILLYDENAWPLAVAEEVKGQT